MVRGVGTLALNLDCGKAFVAECCHRGVSAVAEEMGGAVVLKIAERAERRWL
jgi:hypothetical protein